MLSLIETVSWFAYHQDQAALYAAMEEYDPGLFERVQETIRADS